MDDKSEGARYPNSLLMILRSFLALPSHFVKVWLFRPFWGLNFYGSVSHYSGIIVWIASKKTKFLGMCFSRHWAPFFSSDFGLWVSHVDSLIENMFPIFRLTWMCLTDSGFGLLYDFLGFGCFHILHNSRTIASRSRSSREPDSAHRTLQVCFRQRAWFRNKSYLIVESAHFGLVLTQEINTPLLSNFKMG